MQARSSMIHVFIVQYLPMHCWTNCWCQLNPHAKTKNIEESGDGLPFREKVTEIALLGKRRIYWQSCCPCSNNRHSLSIPKAEILNPTQLKTINILHLHRHPMNLEEYAEDNRVLSPFQILVNHNTVEAHSYLCMNHEDKTSTIRTKKYTFAKLPSPAISRKSCGHKGERTSKPVPKS